MVCLNDDSIGPAVRGCRDDFDFTIKFERVFFSVIPAIVFAALSVTRILFLSRRPKIVGGPVLQIVKLGLSCSYATLSLVLLVLTIMQPGGATDLAVSSAALSLLASLCLVILSFLEHARSPRPSTTLSAYLLLTLVLDVAQVRTIWLIALYTHDRIIFARVFTSALVLKAAMLLLESRPKEKWLLWERKDRSPEETSGIYSLGVFFWLNELFTKGYRGLLSLDDLYLLDRAIASDALAPRFREQLQKHPLNGQSFGLAKLLLRTLAVQFLVPVAPRIALLAFSFCQPFLIEALLDYLQDPQTASKNAGYGLIGATALTYGGIAISTALYWYFQERTMAMARGCIVLAIYEKTTELKLSAAEDSAAITLMSTDVERIRKGVLDLHEYWANSVQVALACWLLQRQLGAAFAVPIVVVLLCALAASFVGKLMGRWQRAWMEAIQKRVGLTANAITQMKLIKVSGMAELIETHIQSLRLVELKLGGRWRMLVVVASAVSNIPLLISPVVTFAVTSNTLDTTTIFVSLSYLNLLASPLLVLFQKLPQLLGALTCLQRIQKFLEYEPRIDFRQFRGSSTPTLERMPAPIAQPEGMEMETLKSQVIPRNSPAVIIRNGNFGWTDTSPVLTNVNVTVPASRLTVVVGPIASGKSTLCKALIGEVASARGEVAMSSLCAKIGYCDQLPFLSNASIRANIIGFSPFCAERYDSVVRATMLYADFAVLPEGDGTIIGNNGIALSGGQRQRVALARALYIDSDLLIFDDVLSGLDANTEEHVFRHVFGHDGLIRRRRATAVLCTHAVRHVISADHIINVRADGTVVEQDGSYEADPSGRLHDSSSNADAVVSRPDLRTGPQPAVMSGTLSTQSEGGDGDDGARQLGDRNVYRHYFGTVGILPVAAFILTAASKGFFTNFPQIWLTYWSNDIAREIPRHSQSYYILIYGLFQVFCLLSLVMACIVVLGPMIKLSGASLHQTALQTVIHAPLRFFTRTDAGTVTNLFSQDMTLIDGELPVALVNLVLEMFTVIGMAGIIATSSHWLTLTFPALVAILWIIQRFYLRTSRQLRLLDLEAKSPLYTHFLDTIKGIATIRALGWVPENIASNSILLDASQRPAYLLAMIQRWLFLTLSLVVMFLATVLVVLVTQLHLSSSLSGASLVTLMSLSQALSDIVRFYTAMETSLGAVARLTSFAARTRSEKRPGEDLEPEKSWPEMGGIEIRGVWASYSSDGDEPVPSDDPVSRSPPDLALRGLDISIEPGEKVAICGRTGSGKSSLILLLLRLLDPLPTGFTLSIDGTPLASIHRQILRQRLITVPQETVFLPEGTTIRDNLDPSGAAGADACRGVLQALDLWDLVASRGGLGATMHADTLSQGQRQVFSLARAVLQRRTRAVAGTTTAAAAGGGGGGGGVLLLDEFSSSVDRATERTLLAVVRREFAGYTVVMVAHRLEMVVDYFDRVVVMDRGDAVEMGDPRVLGARADSWFAELLRASTVG